MQSPKKKAFSRPKNSKPKPNSPRSANSHRQSSQNTQNIIIYTNKELKNFIELSISPTAKKLNVQYNSIINFKGLPSLLKLEELDCSNNKIRNLYRFPVLPNLKEIKISNNPFSDTEYYRISLLIVCSSLQKIDGDLVTISERMQARELYFKCYDLLILGWILEYPIPEDDQIDMIKKELEKQNFNENKKQSNSKSIEIKKYIEIQLKDIDEEMTLSQFENTLKYFSIIEKSLNEDTFLIDKCEIKKENNETFYLTSKLKEFLFDALDNSNKNKVAQKVTESLDRFYMKEMKNQLKLSDVINREIQHFAGSEIINKSENYEEKKEKTKLTTLDDNDEEENSNDENKKGLVDRATQTPKIRGLENISLMIEEQNNDQNDDDE